MPKELAQIRVLSLPFSLSKAIAASNIGFRRLLIRVEALEVASFFFIAIFEIVLWLILKYFSKGQRLLEKISRDASSKLH
ncbi:MAG: hypothetical protein ACFFGZ_08345 [Candidatus Thorarchaeota archaeon]